MSKQTNKSVKMIDVGSKKVTKRVAVAEAFIHLNDSTKNKIYKNKIIKGDVISVAKTAGIVAAKKTSDIIPLCLQIISTCNSSSQTGVEMEALLSVSISALTIYDMCKSLDKSIEIRQIRLLSKKGGKSGNYKR